MRKEQKSSSKNLVESQKKGHHVRRSSIFRPKSSEEQKKVITTAGRSLRRVTVFWHVFTVQYAEMLKKENVWISLALHEPYVHAGHI